MRTFTSLPSVRFVFRSTAYAPFLMLFHLSSATATRELRAVAVCKLLRRMLRRRCAMQATCRVAQSPVKKQNSMLCNPKRNVRVIVIKKKFIVCTQGEVCARASCPDSFHRLLQILWFSVVERDRRVGREEV